VLYAADCKPVFAFVFRLVCLAVPTLSYRLSLLCILIVCVLKSKVKLTSATLSCADFLCKNACSLSCSRNSQKFGAHVMVFFRAYRRCN